MARANEITTFFHCRRCPDTKPANVSPRQWARLEVGLTADGAIQVWCVRHELAIMHTDDLADGTGYGDVTCESCAHADERTAG